MQTWHTGAHRETIPVKKCRKDLSGQQNIQNKDYPQVVLEPCVMTEKTIATPPLFNFNLFEAHPQWFRILTIITSSLFYILSDWRIFYKYIQVYCVWSQEGRRRGGNRTFIKHQHPWILVLILADLKKFQ
jgi:hypothetical protein